jgi:undecaprenyl-diphosphatase
MDQALFHLINEKWTNPALDLFMAAISDIDIWKPFLILIALALLVWGGFKGRAFVFCLLISLLIGDQVTASLKKVVNRHRPKQVQSVRMVGLQKARPEFLTLFKKPNVHLSTEADRKSSGPSFPSGHMTNNTVIAMCCTLFYRRRGAFYGIITAAIGYSRIYLGAHWPSDVLGTLFLAAGETLLIVVALELLWRWVAKRWAPEIYERHSSLIFDANETC